MINDFKLSYRADMKIAIYGAGFRGKQLLEYIGSQYISVIIDADKNKQGTKWNGIEIVSLEEFEKNYISSFIIIGVAYSPDIQSMLEGRGIYHYTDSSKIPSEFYGYGKGNFEKNYALLLSNIKDDMVLLGANAFSILLREYILKVYNKLIPIECEKWANNQLIEWFDNNIGNKHKSKNVKYISTLDDYQVKKHSLSLMGYNVEINAYKYLENNKQYFNDTLQLVKNIYEGGRCFIVATGPSLRLDDLKKISNNGFFSFSVNKIYQFTDVWIPDAYVCTDRFLINNTVEQIKNISSRYKFIGDCGDKYWSTEDSKKYKIHIIGGETLDFSNDIAQKVYGNYTVTNACIQIAAYMGFKEIYLLGVDCNYVKGSANNYAIKDGKVDNLDHNTEGMLCGYQCAKEYADSHGIKIYNATRGGMLEVFERVEFDSLFEKDTE